MENQNITLNHTPHTTSGGRRAYVSGYDVYEDHTTGRWYALVDICHGVYKSGYHAGELCLNPCDLGYYTCSAHRAQEVFFERNYEHRQGNDNFANQPQSDSSDSD